ncbi:MAG: RDD family protein [Candidatus Acidiferrales bacterium]
MEFDPAPQTIPRQPEPQVSYAGFWLRLFAYIIDMFILSIVTGILILGPLMQHAGLSPQHPWVMLTSDSRQVLAINLLMVMAQWCYFALLESSALQASVGKRVLGIYVTDITGKRISFARATGRYFAMIISTLTFGIGYLMAAFTPKKQMLHDIIAESLVLKKTS